MFHPSDFIATVLEPEVDPDEEDEAPSIEELSQQIRNLVNSTGKTKG